MAFRKKLEGNRRKSKQQRFARPRPLAAQYFSRHPLRFPRRTQQCHLRSRRPRTSRPRPLRPPRPIPGPSFRRVRGGVIRHKRSARGKIPKPTYKRSRTPERIHHHHEKNKTRVPHLSFLRKVGGFVAARPTKRRRSCSPAALPPLCRRS